MALEKLGVIAVIEQLNKFLSGADKMDKAIKEVGDETEKTEKKTESMKDTFRKVGAVLGSVAAAIFTAKKAFDFAEEGAQLLRIEQAGENLARSFGTSMDEIVEAVDRAAKGTVARSDIILASNKAMTLGVASSAEQMAQLMEIAAVRAKAMGLTTTQAFSDIVTGIGRMSPMILDNLGILTGGEKTFKTYAESIGKAADELTDAEKKQALFNKVLLETQPQLDKAADQAEDLATTYEQLAVTTKNFGDALKKDVAKNLTPVIGLLNDYLEEQTDLLTIMDEFNVVSSRTSDAFVVNGKVIANGTEELMKWVEAQRLARDADFDSLRLARERLESNREGTQSIEEMTEATKELVEVDVEGQFRNLKNVMSEDLTQGFADYKAAIADLGEDSGEELDRLSEKWRDHTKQVIFNLASQALAIDGLTEEEVKALSKTAEELGLVDPGFAALTEKIFEDAEALEAAGDQSDIFAESMVTTLGVLNDTTIAADNLAIALGKLPTAQTISILGGSVGGVGLVPGGSTTTRQGDNFNLNINTNAPSEDIIADFRMMQAMGDRN